MKPLIPLDVFYDAVDMLTGAPTPPRVGERAYVVRCLTGNAAGYYFARSGVLELWVRERSRAAPMALPDALDLAWDWDRPATLEFA